MEPIRRWAPATALALFSTAWLAMANNGLSWGGDALALPLRFVPVLLVAALAAHLARDRSRAPAPAETAAVLAAVLVAYVLSDYGSWKWFFWIGPEQRGLLRGVGGGSDPIELVDLEDVEADADMEEDDFDDPSELPATSGAFLLERPYGFAPSVSQPIPRCLAIARYIAQMTAAGPLMVWETVT